MTELGFSHPLKLEDKIKGSGLKKKNKDQKNTSFILVMEKFLTVLKEEQATELKSSNGKSMVETTNYGTFVIPPTSHPHHLKLIENQNHHYS